MRLSQITTHDVSSLAKLQRDRNVSRCDWLLTCQSHYKRLHYQHTPKRRAVAGEESPCGRNPLHRLLVAHSCDFYECYCAGVVKSGSDDVNCKCLLHRITISRMLSLIRAKQSNTPLPCMLQKQHYCMRFMQLNHFMYYLLLLCKKS